MNLGKVIQVGSALIGALYAGYKLYTYSNEEPTPYVIDAFDNVSRKTPQPISPIPLETLIELINEVSETMIIVFQQLGPQAIDMAQKRIPDREINRMMVEKFQSTQPYVEKQTCESHGYTHEQYKASCDLFSYRKEVRKALWPCIYLLSILDEIPIGKPNIPSTLTESRVILINNAIFELSIRCIDKIRDELCQQMNCVPSKLRMSVSQNATLKDQVFDLVIDAEKSSKKKILKDEGVSETDMIICNLLYKDSPTFTNAMEAIEEKRLQKLSELGLQ